VQRTGDLDIVHIGALAADQLRVFDPANLGTRIDPRIAGLYPRSGCSALPYLDQSGCMSEISHFPSAQVIVTLT